MTYPLRHPRHHHHHKHDPQPAPQPVPEPTPAPVPAPTPAPAPRPAGVIQWPSYTGEVQFIGTSPRGDVSVYVDPGLGAPVIANGQALLADAERVVDLNTSIFGANPAGPVNVIVFALGGQTDGTGGADHAACNFSQGGNIEVCAAFGNDPMVSALFMAELSECAMNNQLCGLSTGEALSRWCAMVTAPHALDGFATAPAWVQAGMPDFVSSTDPTDQNPVSIGCGMAFLSWLLSKQGVTLRGIAQEMVARGDSVTLADVYAALTNEPATDAWTNFQAAIHALSGGVASISSDDPFGALQSAVATA